MGLFCSNWVFHFFVNSYRYFFNFLIFGSNRIPVKKDSNVEWLPAEKDHMRYLLFKDGEISLIDGDYPFKSRLSNWDPVFRNKTLAVAARIIFKNIVV